MIAPLGDVEEHKIPFEVTSIDITGPYPTTPLGNKYLLTFIDHLTKYVEVFQSPITRPKHVRGYTLPKSSRVMVHVRP